MKTMHSDDVIFLLGAGASCNAGLLSSAAMTKDLESKLLHDPEWTEYYDLYRAVKSAIVHGHIFRNPCGAIESDINIEEFVNVLTELSSYDEHTIYPFVASWNVELVKYAGEDFEKLVKFRDKIIVHLANHWVHFKNVRQAAYYKGLLKFARQTNGQLWVFSLNYDLCVEESCGRENVYSGFEEDPETHQSVWNVKRMLEEDAVSQGIRLFKLHGSLDWRLNAKKQLICEDHPETSSNAKDYQLIFGTRNKLRYDDPYLVPLYLFRQKVHDARLIICIGYSFGDEHINAMLVHAMKQDPKARLLSVTQCDNEYADGKYKDSVVAKLQVSSDRVDVQCLGAAKFLGETLDIEFVRKLMPDDEAPF